MSQDEGAHPMTSIIDKKLADAIDGPLDRAQNIPCDYTAIDGRQNCIDDQLKPKHDKRKGWHDIDSRKLCASCACYWHLSCARNFALGVVR
jgi:hypothetical protein